MNHKPAASEAGQEGIGLDAGDRDAGVLAEADENVDEEIPGPGSRVGHRNGTVPVCVLACAGQPTDQIRQLRCQRIGIEGGDTQSLPDGKQTLVCLAGAPGGLDELVDDAGDPASLRGKRGYLRTQQMIIRVDGFGPATQFGDQVLARRAFGRRQGVVVQVP